MTTSAMLLGLAWKSLVIAGLTLVVLRLARSRSAGERSMIAHAGLAALLGMQDDLSNAELDELEKMIAKARDGRMK